MKHLSPLFFALFIVFFAAISIGCSDDEPSKSNNKTDIGILQDTSLPDTQEADTEEADTEETDTEETDTEETDTEETDTEETDTEEPAEFSCPTGHHLVESAEKCTDAGNIADRERGCLTVESQDPPVFCAADQTVDCTRVTIDSCPEGYSETDKATCEGSDKSCGFYLLCDFMAWCLED